MNDLNQIEFSYKNLEGVVRKCIVTPLRRKEAMRIFHEVLLVVLTAIDTDKGLDLSKAIRELSFSKIEMLADSMLKFAMIDGQEIKSFDDTDFFEKYPEELYLVLVYAIKENFPDFFTRIKKVMGKGLPDMSQILK